MKMSEKIQALEVEAGSAGDLLQAAIAQLALNGYVSDATWQILSAKERASVRRYTRATAFRQCEELILS